MSRSKSIRPPQLTHHKASGQAVVRLNGHDHYLGLFGSDRANASYDSLIATWLAHGRRLPPPDRPLVVNEIILAYIAHAERWYVKDGKPTTMIHNVKRALGFVRKGFGYVPAVDFGPKALRSCQRAMIEADLAMPTVNAHTSAIRAMFKWAVAEEMLPGEVHHRLSTVDGVTHRDGARIPEPVVAVTDATVEACLPHMPPMVAAMVQLQRLTGMRPGEVIVMRAVDLDTSGDVWTYKPHTHKTQHHRRERVIAIGPRAQEILRPWLTCEIAEYIFSPKREAAGELVGRSTVNGRRSRRGLLINDRARPPGDQYRVGAYRRAIERATDRAYPPPADLDAPARKRWRRDHRWAPNQLRHTAAEEIRRDFGLDAAQVVLGHAKANITQVYACADTKQAADVMRRIG